MDTNLKGTYFCCLAAGKRMIERRKGNIFNMTSGDGKRVSGVTCPHRVVRSEC